MSTINKFKKVNEKISHLIFGYVRSMEIKNRIIPTSIIDLLILFYHSNTPKIASIVRSYSYDTQPPQICIAELSVNKSYQCN